MTAIGQPWLSDEELAARQRIADRRLIFEGKHKQYFFAGNRTDHAFKSVGPNASKVLYITENLPGRCTLKYADLLFGEPLLVEAGDPSPRSAEAVERIAAGAGLHPLLLDAAATASWAGRAWWQILVDRGAVRCEAVAPEHVFGRWDVSGRRLRGAAVKYRLRAGGVWYLRVIDHSPGQIRHELWRLGKDGNRVEARADLAIVEAARPEVEATGIDEPAIVELPNYAPAGGTGASDYDDECLTLVDEVNNRRSQISRILDIHGDPVVVALEDLFDEQGNLKVSGRAIRTDDPTKDPVKYVTWEAKLEWQMKSLAGATDAFLGHLEIAPQLVGLGGATSADSWKKYKLAATQTLARVNRKRTFFAPAIRAAFRVGMLLERAHAIVPAYAVAPVALTWSDGLPVDEEEEMRVTTGYHAAGLLSTRRALMRIHNGDPAIVEEELAELAAEREAGLPTSFRRGRLDLAGAEEAARAAAEAEKENS